MINSIFPIAAAVRYVGAQTCAPQRKSPLPLLVRFLAFPVAVDGNLIAHPGMLFFRDHLVLIQIVVVVIEPYFLCHNVSLLLVVHYGSFQTSFFGWYLNGSQLFIIGIGPLFYTAGRGVFFPSISAF